MRQFAHKALAAPKVLLSGFFLAALHGSFTFPQIPPALPEQVGAQPAMVAGAQLIVEEDLMAIMRDGIRIAIDVYRPAAAGAFPALYAAGPFPHEPVADLESNPLLGPVAWHVSQGYAVALASVRGTGRSEGNYQFLSRAEQQDHYEIVQWIARQPWSNGRVGGFGAGYYAASQWLAALQNPPNLACIAPLNGALDPYRDWLYPGGLTNASFVQRWYDSQVRLANVFPPAGPARLIDFDLRYQQLSHPYYDDYWRLRNALEGVQAIDIPVFAVSGWNPDALGLGSTIQALAELRSLSKLLLLDWADSRPFYQDARLLADELLPFYDWCLKDAGAEADNADDEMASGAVQPDNEIRNEGLAMMGLETRAEAFPTLPRIRYAVRGAVGELQETDAWPPAETQRIAFYLNGAAAGDRDFALTREAPTADLGLHAYDTGQPNALIRFASAPLEQDMDLVGPITLELHAASSAPDTAFAVSLWEQPAALEAMPAGAAASDSEDGFSSGADSFSASGSAAMFAENGTAAGTAADPAMLISQGMLKASARSTAENRGSEFRPYYPFSGAEPLAPGRVYLFRIALGDTAYRLRQGSRLALVIAPAHDGALGTSPRRDSFYYSRQYPSHLWLQVVP